MKNKKVFSLNIISLFDEHPRKNHEKHEKSRKSKKKHDFLKIFPFLKMEYFTTRKNLFLLKKTTVLT